ncbi:MAG: deoxyribodipyrimidine photo-lyase, partial [Chloroflexi bacterium]|nr:deoxyribodipyrimidine photo-lyase [Chloroflexota bacterium]
MRSDASGAVLWFRRDLRLHDLPALAAALAHERVAPLFVFDEALLAGRWRSPNRVAFLLGSLAVLAEELARRGSRLHLRWGRPVAVVPAFAHEAGASVVYCSREYSPYGRRRDRAVATALAAEGRTLTRLPGVLVHEPEAVRKADGSPYTVYTPFRKSWEQVPRRQPLPAPERLPPPPPLAAGTLPSLAELGLGTPSPQSPAPGEVAARQRLQRFLDEGLAHYAERRDLLAIAGTSRLSQDLRWGLLSPLEVVSRAQASPQFVAELVWREFYYSILFHFPEVVHQEFQARYRGLPWREAPAELAAWREGRTGYPLVDAGMRQLAATGYLHNRARMVVASFLTNSSTVAFVVGTLICAVPVYIGYLPVPNWLVSLIGHDRLFEQLSIAGQFQPFGIGVIPVVGVLYFISFAGLMLYINLVLIGERHWAGGSRGVNMGWQYTVRAVSLAITLISANSLLANVNRRIDMTSERLYTLTPTTKRLLSELRAER